MHLQSVALVNNHPIHPTICILPRQSERSMDTRSVFDISFIIIKHDIHPITRSNSHTFSKHRSRLSTKTYDRAIRFKLLLVCFILPVSDPECQARFHSRRRQRQSTM